MSASTLGDILITPPVEWEMFAKEWVEISGKEDTKSADDLDELTDAMGGWGTHEVGDGTMED
jgi:hypothetical protein